MADALTTYELTAHCRDLPELIDSRDGELTMAFPDGELGRVIAAVAGRREPGAQARLDVWCHAR